MTASPLDTSGGLSYRMLEDWAFMNQEQATAWLRHQPVIARLTRSSCMPPADYSFTCWMRVQWLNARVPFIASPQTRQHSVMGSRMRQR